jgi:hypothetical protein
MPLPKFIQFHECKQVNGANPMPARRFPPPWSVKKQEARRSTAKLLERDEARRIAVNAWKHEMVPGAGAVSMDDHPDAADNPLDQTEQELLISTVSDEALEKAACGTSWAQTYPQTCVATICVGDSSFPKKLNGQIPNAR